MTDSLERIELAEFSSRDERGSRVSPLEAAGLPREELEHFHVVSLKPGATRGNHRHERGTEWLLILSGPARVTWCNTGQETVRNLRVEANQPALLRIPPGVAHSVFNSSNRELFLVAFSDASDQGTVSTTLLSPEEKETAE